jgi:ATP-binding cassette subfamily B protein/subfamily B ATP-binding cassette protein MsbA
LLIKPGEHVAIIGASGQGKSTILKLIGRFYDPGEGEILLDGIPLKHMSFASIRQGCGYVFQDTYLTGGSVKENIRFGRPEATDQEVIAAAKAAYAHDFIVNLSDGYDTIVGERAHTLSGGQKQRISIARMIIRNPAVVLLDEATSALDTVSELEVQKALETLLQGRTVIAVAHRLSTIENFDRIIVLDQGEIAESGNYEQLASQRGLLYQMAGGNRR